MEKSLQLNELSHFDGENLVKFNIVEFNTEKKEITVAITNQGKISVHSFDLLKANDGRLFFDYGIMREEIAVKDFTKIKEEN